MEISTGMMEIGSPHFIFSQPLLKSITEHPEHSQLKTH